MKKTIIGVVLCLSLAVFAFSGGFSIKLNGGANFLMGGDYNKIIEDTNAFMHTVPVITVGGALEKLSMGWNFGAEFIYNITDRMGVGLGVGYVTASNESTYTRSGFGLQYTERLTPSISSIPVTLNFHYVLPVSDMMNVRVTVGPGLYMSTFKWDIYQALGTPADPDILNATVAYRPDGVMSFGFQGGLGIEFALSPTIFLCLDVLGRMAGPSGFSGPWTQTGAVTDSGSGTFYYYEIDGYASYVVWHTTPSGIGFSSVREASVSLSGVVAQFGVKINI